MKKTLAFQGLAISSILIVLAGCGKDRKKHNMAQPPMPVAGMLTDQLNDSSMSTSEKFHLIATQLDEITTKNVHGSLGGTNPPHLHDASGFFFDVDFLWWRADEEGLDYAVKTKGTNQFGSGPYQDVKQHIHSPDFEWKPGFRIGVGGIFGGHDHWDLYGAWTYLHSDTENETSTTDTSAEPISALFMPQYLTGDFNTRARAEWDLNYNMADLELGRDYFISEAITLRPHLGLRGGRIDQDLKAHYKGQIISVGTTTRSFNVENKMHGENDYIGGGMRAGADFLWHFCRNIGLFGQISGSLLYGKFDIEQKYNFFASSSTGGSGTSGIVPIEWKQHRELWRTRSNLQGAIGLTFEQLFHKNRFRFGLNLAYEFSQWFQQNMLADTTVQAPFALDPLTALNAQKFDIETREGDLGLQGFTGSVTFDF